MVKLTVQQIREAIRYKHRKDEPITLIQGDSVVIKSVSELREVTKRKHRKDFVTINDGTYLIERGRQKRPGGIVKVDYQKVFELHANGMRQTEIAKMLGVSASAVWQIVNKKRLCQNEN